MCLEKKEVDRSKVVQSKVYEGMLNATLDIGKEPKPKAKKGVLWTTRQKIATASYTPKILNIVLII